MNCLNRLEIQKYLDNEINPEEKETFLEHMQTCDSCKDLWDHAKKEAEEANRLISFARIQEDQIDIPVFMVKHKSDIRKKWIIYSSVAAGIILIIGVTQYNLTVNARNERIENARLEIERYIYESDPNKLWNEKQSIITVIDGDGNLIYLNN